MRRRLEKKPYNQLYSIYELVVSLACIDCIKVKKSKYPIHGFIAHTS